MKKLNKLYLSSLLFILPVIMVVRNYSSLPDEIPMHYNFIGKYASYGNKIEIIYSLGFLFFVSNLVVLFITMSRRASRQNYKLLIVLSLIVPIFSVFFTYFIINSDNSFEKIALEVSLFLTALAFMLIGLLLPTLKHNGFIGIRTPSTINNIDIWTKTHKYAGIAMLVGGCIAIFALVFELYVIYAIALIVPVVFALSYPIYLKKKMGE